MASHPLSQLRPGDRVRDYEVEGLLGQGGFGRVYKAYHPRLRRRAAIKVMNERPDAQGISRFEREAQAVAALRHPAILTVFDFGELDGDPFMVLEFMPNGSLAERLTDKPLPPDDVLAILAPIGDALDHAHRQGVIHRDVKPGNVFLDANLQPVLADFGLSKFAQSHTITVSGAISGTPAYIAPEMAQGREPTGASDVYALAVMAFQLLTGELPFRSEAGPLAVLYQHISQAPPPATDINPALPAAVDDVLARGMAKRPDDRWPNARAMVRALADALGLAAPATQPDVAPAKLELPSKQRGRLERSGLVRPAALLAVTLVAAGALYAILHATARPSSPPPPAVSAPAATPRCCMVVDNAGTLVRGKDVHVQGGPLDPSRPSTIFIQEGSINAPIVDDGPHTDASGNFDLTGIVNPALANGSATLKACSLNGPHQPDLTTCIATPVQVTS